MPSKRSSSKRRICPGVEEARWWVSWKRSLKPSWSRRLDELLGERGRIPLVEDGDVGVAEVFGELRCGLAGVVGVDVQIWVGGGEAGEGQAAE